MATHKNRNAGDVEVVFRAPEPMYQPGLQVLPTNDRAMYLLNSRSIPGEPAHIPIARVGAEGKPDAGFGDGGVVTVIIEQLDNSAFPAGLIPKTYGGVIAAVRTSFKLGLVSLNVDGSLDKHFGYDGIIVHGLPTTQSETSATTSPQDDDSVLAFQGAFANAGRGEVTPAPGGGLYYAWNTGPSGPPPGSVLRTKPNGPLDTSFGNDGIVEVYYPGSVQTIVRGAQSLSDGSVMVFGGLLVPAGNGSEAFAARLHENGKLDRTFGTEGFVVWRASDFPELNLNRMIFTSAVEAPDGTTVFSGIASDDQRRYGLLAAVDRLGVPSPSFNGGKPVLFGLPGTVEFFERGCMAIQADGKIVVGGYSAVDYSTPPVDMLVVRFLADGKIDTSFAPPRGWIRLRPLGGTYNYVWSLALTTDGKILIAGESTEPETEPGSEAYARVVVRISS